MNITFGGGEPDSGGPETIFLELSFIDDAHHYDSHIHTNHETISYVVCMHRSTTKLGPPRQRGRSPQPSRRACAAGGARVVQGVGLEHDGLEHGLDHDGAHIKGPVLDACGAPRESNAATTRASAWPPRSPPPRRRAPCTPPCARPRAPPSPRSR